MLIESFLAEVPKAKPRRKRLQKYKLRKAKTPQEGYPLAGVMALVEDLGPHRKPKVGKTNVKFDESLVLNVASILPMGLYRESPAMLVLLTRYNKDYSSIIACYTDLTFPHVLWREPTKRPEWLYGS